MKKLLFIITLLFLLKPVLPFVEYVVNYEYIAMQLCENKSKPELKCNGKCHLVKELAKASENEKPLSQNKKNSNTEIEILFYNTVTEFQFNITENYTDKENKSSYLNLYQGNFSNLTFHPPLI
ncbi:hypothetical protein ACFS5J_08450 [Flavobacterium chuncheonense]|uniref:Uncharacterized protein n=1 Tax=Flavobacterium chuncheonense TaxID=2026653 RepID=A0ABW5YLU7_9FLAO